MVELRQGLRPTNSRAIFHGSFVEAGNWMNTYKLPLKPTPPFQQVVRFLKGKSAILIARIYLENGKNFRGQHFCGKAYFVFTVGQDEQRIRKYKGSQEKRGSSARSNESVLGFTPPLGGTHFNSILMVHFFHASGPAGGF